MTDTLLIHTTLAHPSPCASHPHILPLLTSSPPPTPPPLPDELCVEIASWVACISDAGPAIALCRLGAVSRRWRNDICGSDQLWLHDSSAARLCNNSKKANDRLLSSSSTGGVQQQQQKPWRNNGTIDANTASILAIFSSPLRSPLQICCELKNLELKSAAAAAAAGSTLDLNRNTPQQTARSALSRLSINEAAGRAHSPATPAARMLAAINGFGNNGIRAGNGNGGGGGGGSNSNAAAAAVGRIVPHSTRLPAHHSFGSDEHRSSGSAGKIGSSSRPSTPLMFMAAGVKRSGLSAFGNDADTGGSDGADAADTRTPISAAGKWQHLSTIGPSPSRFCLTPTPDFGGGGGDALWLQKGAGGTPSGAGAGGKAHLPKPPAPAAKSAGGRSTTRRNTSHGKETTVVLGVGGIRTGGIKLKPGSRKSVARL